MADKVIELARFQHKLPDWVSHQQLLPLHPQVPRSFYERLAQALETDEQSPVIDYGAAMSRVFGLSGEEVAGIISFIGMLAGGQELCCRATARLDQLLLDTSLERAVRVAEYGWSRSGFSPTGKALQAGCREILICRRSERWRSLEEVLKHISVLIEAARLEAGGREYDPRVAEEAV